MTEVERQIAYSDIILLNKVDLVPEGKRLAAVEGMVREINAGAVIHRTTRSALDMGLLLGRRLYQLDGAAQLDALAVAGAQHDAGAHVHAHAHASGEPCTADCTSGGVPSPSPSPPAAAAAAVEIPAAGGQPEAAATLAGPAADGEATGAPDLGAGVDAHAGYGRARHGSGIGTVNLVVPGVIVEARFRSWVEQVLWDRGPGKPDVLRIKGMLTLASHPGQRAMLQGVYELYDVYTGHAWAPGEDTRCRLLVVGTGLDQGALLQGLQRCVQG